MASANVCDPCATANRSLVGTKYCSECKERLCTDCAEAHTMFKAFKYHHVTDLFSADSNIPISDTESCHVHLEMLLDCYCTDHDIVCCRTCISNEHKVCQNVLLLELASKDVKKSELFTDVIQERKHLFTTLNDFNDNRQSCLQSQEKSKTAISQQIGALKSKLLKQIDHWELELNARVSSLQRKQEMEINKQKEEISQVLESLKANESEIDYLEHHGSNNQLFIALRHQVTNFQIAEANIKQMVLSSEEIVINFHENKDVKIDSFGSLVETSKSCQFEYRSRKLQQAQVIAEPPKRFVEFQKDTELELKKNYVKFNLSDLSVTADDKLLMTNDSSLDPKLYVYRDFKYATEIKFSSGPRCFTVIPDTDKAVVTLPKENCIQFINTTKMTTGKQVKVGFKCIGITAGSDRIYVGGEGGTMKTLNTNGKVLKTHASVNRRSDINFMLYNNVNEQVIASCEDTLLCLKLDGTEVYSRDVLSIAGVARDRHSNIYFGDF
ncbi:unnamed protein product [Mytilus coruscus]|uniref:B box-type domain-containing protein n=1 Tax=Mytilus coruscus TaxID=42192 RepID=A0A6J8BJ64_MYTCO|nr:unnamed protein product [Mytilus coruscus]